MPLSGEVRFVVTALMLRHGIMRESVAMAGSIRTVPDAPSKSSSKISFNSSCPLKNFLTGSNAESYDGIVLELGKIDKVLEACSFAQA
jgi:hypothetical protein